MEHNEDLARLEQFVEKLIDSHKQLQNENSEMQAQLLTKQQEIVDLQGMIKNLQEDRNVMHSRVTGLIDRIDEWEKNFEQEEAAPQKGSGNGENHVPPKKSSSLFKVKAEQSSESTLR